MAERETPRLPSPAATAEYLTDAWQRSILYLDVMRRRAAQYEAHAAGLFIILPLEGDALAAIARIMGRYEDAGLQLADAALIHLAERENIRTVFTLDRRDFSLVRLTRNRTLRLIPDMP